MGASTAVSTAELTSTHPTSENVAVPAMRPRVAVTRWLTGLTSTQACSQPGIVDGSTNTLLANVSGNSSIMLTPITAFGVRMISPRIVNVQLSENENTSRSSTASRTPTAPPSGRKPSRSPSPIVTADAME
jgi:hypothetical protein